MKCSYNIEDISSFVDDLSSIEAMGEFKEHMATCKECREAYHTLGYTRDFLKQESVADESIHGKVLNAIDKTKYQKKTYLYQFLGRLFGFKQILKPVMAVLIVCLVVFAVFNYRSYVEDFAVTYHQDSSMKPVNILFMGGDRINKNTDTIILLNYHPENAKLNMLFVPRDVPVYKNIGSSTTSQKIKIGQIYPVEGAHSVVQTLSSLLNIGIDYYIQMDTTSVAKIIDLLGGVDFDIPVDLHYDDPLQKLNIHFEKGMQHLNGQQVMDYLRFRRPNTLDSKLKRTYDGSDLKRIEAQQNIIKEILKQKANTQYLTKIKDIVETGFQDVETDLTISEMLKILKNVSKINPEEVNTFVLPGSTEKRDSFYYTVDKEEMTRVIEYFSTN